jgi:serine/threonine protein kinase
MTNRRTPNNQSVIMKNVNHFRLQNERDILKQFQYRSPFIRPLINEIIELADPPAIVLKHLNDHLLNASLSQKLTNKEIKYITKRILKALKILHEDGFIHTDTCEY